MFYSNQMQICNQFVGLPGTTWERVQVTQVDPDQIRQKTPHLSEYFSFLSV